jgi:hypothetical protein
MKIRAGFVSNSSSSSFCVYGVEMDLNKFKKLIKRLDINFNISNDLDLVSLLNKKYDEDEYDVFDVIDGAEKKFMKLLGLIVRASGEEETIYIGRSFNTLRDDETGEQFKKSVQEKLPGVKCKYLNEVIGVPD